MKIGKHTMYKMVVVISCQLIAIYGTAQVQPLAKDTSKYAAPMAVSTPGPAVFDTNIHVQQSALVQTTDNKLYQYQRYNHGTSPGFRVQINFGQEKNDVYKTQTDFSAKYPNVHSYVTYKQPYFRVSVGDFRTRLEAVYFLNTVKKDYPAAFVVADKIVPPALQ